jgi:holliday junction DNA helicase RuvB
VLTPGETEEEVVVNLSLRPKDLGEFVGQSDVTSALHIAVSAAQQRGEPLEHMILSGPPGLGKTSLAYCLGNEMNAKVVATSGPAITRAGDLVGILTNLQKGDILFIDEIHRLSHVVEEFLYSAMEDFQIDFVIDKGPYAKNIKFALKPFTLIGATTREGLLTSPMRSRFGHSYHFDFYDERSLALIIARSAALLETVTDDDAAFEIAHRARGTPRIANRLLRRVRDYAQVRESGKITKTIAIQAMEFLRVDSLGLDEPDRKYLRVLITTYAGGPAGVEALAATMSEETDTLVDIIEPFLLKAAFLIRTQRGRVATEKAYMHLGLAYNKDAQPKLF